MQDSLAKRGRTNKLMVLRFCQDDLRSQTLYVKRRHLQAQPPSHLTECGPIVTLQLCQQIHVQTIQCVNSANCLLSNQPRAFFPVILVYQHSLTMRLHPGLLPSPEGRAHRHSQDSSSRRFSCRGLVQVIAKMPTSHCSQCCNSMHVACLSCSSSSLFSRHGPFTVPVAKVVCRCNKLQSVLHPTQPIPTVVSILSVLQILAPARSICNMVPIILCWSVGSMVSRKPNPAHWQ